MITETKATGSRKNSLEEDQVENGDNAEDDNYTSEEEYSQPLLGPKVVKTDATVTTFTHSQNSDFETMIGMMQSLDGKKKVGDTTPEDIANPQKSKVVNPYAKKGTTNQRFKNNAENTSK